MASLLISILCAVLAGAARRRGRVPVAAVVAALVAGPVAAAAQTPVIFVHGNGDHAGLWDNVIWRFASNGYPASRLFAVDLPNPTASSTITAVEVNRSTPEDQTAALAAFVTRVLLKTGAPKVALVGSSRGGMTIRNYVRFGGGAAHVSHVITGGTPNHGVFAIPTMQPDGEFNGAGAYLRALNRGSEVVVGVKFLALRSDSLDKYAQADGAGLGMKGTSTNVDATGPALRGALNIVLPGTDHREVAFGPAAFRAQYRFITGREPTTMDIVADTVAVLEGMISGNMNASPTNLPLANAVITIHAVDAATGQRLGAPVYRAVTSSSGRWGPFRASPTARYEFEVASPDSAVILHVFRLPFPRSSRVVNFRFPAPPAARRDSVSVLIARPRGYLGLGRDTVEFDGTSATGIPPGVPTVDRAIRWFGASEPITVRTRVNGETIIVRTQPGDKRRLVSAEFQRE